MASKTLSIKIIVALSCIIELSSEDEFRSQEKLLTPNVNEKITDTTIGLHGIDKYDTKDVNDDDEKNTKISSPCENNILALNVLNDSAKVRHAEIDKSKTVEIRLTTSDESVKSETEDANNDDENIDPEVISAISDVIRRDGLKF
uniref:Plasmodium yoelii subtelomeric region (PYST-C1) n=1 Tax=Ascaris lumbricoides TaxID=6252 RepID=A0A0M3HGX1_ASCLU